MVGLYNGNGELVAKYDYDTWGKVKSVKDANNTNIIDQNHVGNLNPFRYRGYYYDKETQLYYLMSRYYDPVTHRFLNADGYFQTGSRLLDTNMNAYCDNNPVNYSDPTGEDNNCPIHGDYFWQPNCIYCRPEYKKQLQKELDRGQPIWIPDGGTFDGKTLNQKNGVAVKTDQVTYVPPSTVKDLKERKQEYYVIIGGGAASILDILRKKEKDEPPAVAIAAVLVTVLIELKGEADYRNLCAAVDRAAENGNGLVILHQPYCDDPRATAGQSFGSDWYMDWNGSYGQCPFAYK